MTTTDVTRTRVEWTLRIGAAGCFIGHGAFGIITKQDWIPFFGLVGIGSDTAMTLQPWIGTIDIVMGLSVLVWPTPIVLLWMTLWAIWTAALRPLDGRGLGEFFERAGNYGVPLALLIWARATSGSFQWIRRVAWPPLDDKLQRTIAWILRISTALLLVGHGSFGLLMKKTMLLTHFASIGIEGGDVLLTRTGAFEIILGLVVLVAPRRPVLAVVVAWKVFTELLYPLSGDWIWEFVERAGSYAAPLALVWLSSVNASTQSSHPTSTRESI